MGGKSGGGGSSVIGYRYRITMQFALCHGPIDAIRSIWFGDKVAWEGDMRRVGDNSRLGAINKPGLFGGEESEGGVSGNFELGYGTANQNLIGVNADGTTDAQAYLTITPDGPAQPWAPEMGTHYRGMAVLNLLRFYIGMNPYIKDLSVEAERYWDGWYPEVSKIGVDTNPAHIIYECLTNASWGLGYDRDTIDDSAFRAAAQTLHAEGFGLSILWSEQQALEDFIDGIKEIIDATFYLNTRTGLWTLRLIREGDPVKAQVNPDNAKLTSFKRKALGETINELNVKWELPETEEFVTLTIHDQANIEAQGQVITGTREYAGVRSEGLAGFIGQRDLQVAAATLAEMEVDANRSLWDVYPGDVVEFSWPPYGITSMRCRIKETTHSQEAASGIKLAMVEDVFGQVSNVFSGDNSIGWVDTRTEATLFSPVTIWEIPYWFVVQAANSVAPETTYGAALAVTDNPGIRLATLYASRVRPSGEVFEIQDRRTDTPSGTLGQALGRSFTSNLVLPTDTITTSKIVEPDAFVVIGEGVDAEIARIDGAFLTNGSAMQITRGLMDTHIRPWPVGTRVYVIGYDNFLVDSIARSVGEEPSYKVVMQTSIDTLEVADVPAVQTTLNGRQGLPYPPQNVRIGGVYWPSSVTSTTGALQVSWATRNRLLQDGEIQLAWNDSGVVPEAGTTYVCRLRQGSTQLDEQVTDGSSVELSLEGFESGTLTVELWSERDAWRSYQVFSHTLDVENTAPPPAVPVQVSNPGTWPIPANGSLTKLPLYTENQDPLNEFSTSNSTFTPQASGTYRVEAQISPTPSGTGAFAPSSTFRLGFGSSAVTGPKVVTATAPSTATAFSVTLDDTFDLTAGSSYFLFVSQSSASGVRMTSASLTITKVG